MLALVVLFLIATLTSALGVVVGIGGGVILLPTLKLFYGVETPVAVGTTAICLFAGSLTATFLNLKQNLVDRRATLIMLPSLILGALVGAKLTTILSGQILELIFLVFAVFAAYRLWPRGRAKNLETSATHATTPKSVGRFSILGFFAGLMAGLLGIGGGVVVTPLLISIFGFTAARATATSFAVILATSFSASVGHVWNGNLDSNLTVVCALGFAVGAMFGRRFQQRVSDDTLKKLVAVIVLAAASAMIIGD
jgi:uncharacterized protein